MTNEVCFTYVKFEVTAGHLRMDTREENGNLESKVQEKSLKWKWSLIYLGCRLQLMPEKLIRHTKDDLGDVVDG